MKAEILTIHRLNNFGSAFQAMALYKYIDELGIEAELLDYHPAYFQGNKLRNYIGRILYYRELKERERKFNHFIESNTKLSKRRYRRLRELEENPPQADLYIAGGDQLWNYYHACGQDDAYKLVFWKGNKISYGTSMGGGKFSAQQLGDLKQKIMDYSFLSLRERRSVQELAEMGLSATWVVDPVMLLEPQQYYKFMQEPKETEKYVFVYLVAPSKLLDEAVSYFMDVCHYKVIVYAGFSHKCRCHVQERALGPEEVIGYIKNAEFVLSSSFHATVFSIMFKKKFGVILPGEETNERIHDLLAWTGIEDTIMYQEDDIKKVIEKKVWYTPETDAKIAARVAESKQYLNTAIKGAV